MYIKFKGYHSGVRVRDVRRFGIRKEDCGEPDGTTTHGAELYDCSYEDAADFMDSCIEYGCGLLAESVREMRGRAESRDNPYQSPWQVYAVDYTDNSALAWFNSIEAAERVLSDLCAALDKGRRFFDLTRYNEEGWVAAE